jgi:hypothetical protein
MSHTSDAAARGFPESTADAANFKDSVYHCALTPLHVLIMISKEFYTIFRPNKKDNGRMIGM